MNIKYTPRFTGAIFGRSVNICKRAYPQLCAEHEFDDLMQEAFLVFQRCRELYSKPHPKWGVVDKPQWFMALFSRALSNHFIKMIPKHAGYISLDALGSEEPATEFDVGYAYRRIQELPKEVHDLMAAVVSGTVADGRIAFAKIKRKHNTFSTLVKGA